MVTESSDVPVTTVCGLSKSMLFMISENVLMDLMSLRSVMLHMRRYSSPPPVMISLVFRRLMALI